MGPRAKGRSWTRGQAYIVVEGNGAGREEVLSKEVLLKFPVKFPRFI
jgi:hypothetical protein